MRQERRLRREEAQLARRGQLARIGPLWNGSSITNFSETVNFPNQTNCDYHITGIFFQKIQGPASLLSPKGSLEAWLTCVAVASLLVIAPSLTSAHSCSPMFHTFHNALDSTERHHPNSTPNFQSIVSFNLQLHLSGEEEDVVGKGKGRLPWKKNQVPLWPQVGQGMSSEVP